MRRIVISLLAGCTGIALTLSGLAVDAWLHARDETLAAREGVFTLSNPGHAVLVLGITMTSGGILAALYFAWGMLKTDGILGRRWVRLASMQAAGAMAVGAVFVALATTASGHDHPSAGVRVRAETMPADAPLALEDSAMTGSAASHVREADDMVDIPNAMGETPPPAADHHMAEPANEEAASAGELMGASPSAAPVTGAHTQTHAEGGDMAMAAPTPAAHHPKPTAEELACLADLTAQAKALTTRFEDFNVALTEGYAVNRGDPSSTHHPNRAYKRDGVIFDLSKPESLIYVTQDDGSKRFVGVLYHAPVGQGPTPCGNATYWHTHGSCIDAAGTVIPESKDKTCPAGYTYRPGNVEMMHLWFVPRGQRS